MMMMIKAELQESYFDTERNEFEARPLATLIVEEDGGHSGEHVERFGLRKAVVDPTNGARVLFGEDPYRWLQLLPGAYRSGDINVAILQDDRAQNTATATVGGLAVAG